MGARDIFLRIQNLFENVVNVESSNCEQIFWLQNFGNNWIIVNVQTLDNSNSYHLVNNIFDIAKLFPRFQLSLDWIGF